MNIGHPPPTNKLTCEQRISEIGEILATGLQRLWEVSESKNISTSSCSLSSTPFKIAHQREVSVDISAHQSVNRKPDIR